MRYIILTFILGLIFFSSCEKDTNTVNPFDDLDKNQDTVGLIIIDPEPTSIAGIFQNTFKPTCANVGCHDGTFDPDFRTMESSYNTLLFQEPVKNDGTYKYRVEPYNSSKSVIMARLYNALSPQMPIQIEPDSDWPTKGDQYIADIKAWIDNGAPDVTGNVRELNSAVAKMRGAGVQINGEWLERKRNAGATILPDSSQASLYIALSHDDMMADKFSHNQIRFSMKYDSFETKLDMPLEVLSTPILGRGFTGELESFTHRINLDIEQTFGTTSGQWFFRVYVKDNINPITEIPSNNGIYYVKEYMSIVLP